MSMMVMIMSFS